MTVHPEQQQSREGRGKQRFLLVLLHLAFWLVSMGIMYLLYARILDNASAALFVILYTLPIYLAAVYFTTGVTIPRAIASRNSGRLLLLLAYTALGILFLEIVFFLFLVLDVFPLPRLDGYLPPRNAIDIIVISAGVFIVTLMAMVLTLLRYWYAADRRSQLLRQQQLTAELAMLRAQVHPHFLFNTLNNLYALTLQKSDRAPEVVLKLSELLDYMLHESQAESIPVEREMQLLEHYLDLERLRHGSRVRISCGKDIAHSQQLAPLLLLPLVENSFKHGVSRDSGEAWVDISLRSTSSGIEFQIRNSVPAEQGTTPAHIENGSGGIGLRNVRERLQLLYPARHRFHAGLQGEVFDVTLSITPFPQLPVED
jgi:sensor histidine kinase YesM